MSKGNDPASAGSGSPPAGEPDYLVIGYLRRPHGVHGEILMDVHTDFPERLKAGTQVFVGNDHRPMTVAGRRRHQDGLLVSFKGLETPEQAGQYRNQWVYVTTADRPALPKGQYYFHELIGLTVVDEKGDSLGQLTDIMHTGANDVYVVTRVDGSEVLLPAVPSVVLEVGLESRQMRVRLLPGLLEEDT